MMLEKAILELKSMISGHIDKVSDSMRSAISQTNGQHLKLVRENSQLERRNLELKRENAKLVYMQESIQKKKETSVKQNGQAKVITPAVLKRPLRSILQAKSTGRSQTKVADDENDDGVKNLESDEPTPPKKKVKTQSLTRKKDSSTNDGNRVSVNPSTVGTSSCNDDWKEERRGRNKKVIRRKTIERNVEIPMGVQVKSTVDSDKISFFVKEGCTLMLNSAKKDFWPKLTCANQEGMRAGHIFLLQNSNISLSDKYKINLEACGFRHDFRNSNLSHYDHFQGWMHRLVRLSRDNNSATKTKTYAFRSMAIHSAPRSNGIKDLAERDFFETCKYGVPLSQQPDKEPCQLKKTSIYLHVRQRNRLLPDAPGINLTEMQVIKVYHASPSLESFLVGTLAVKFMHMANRPKTYFDPGDYLPHPTVHDPKCKEHEEAKSDE